MKFLLSTILLTLALFSDDVNHHQIRILEKVFLEISIDTKMIVWSDNQKILNELKNHNKLTMADKCKDATILILENKIQKTKACESKPTFVLNYDLLSEIPQSFGALFWKKGRPNIVIIKPRIESQSIKISKDLRPYLEDKVW